MCGLAAMAVEQGFQVSGSDSVASEHTEHLIDLGVNIYIGQRSENITSHIDMVVYTAAIHEDNPERVRAKELNIPQVERADYLGYLSHIYPKAIGVSGTHGKTTTSSMLAAMMVKAGLDPSVSVGGDIPEIGGNACLGHSDYFVMESCEYVDSFLKTQHEIGIITNIEADHHDYFTGGLPQIKESFVKFGRIIPQDGLMIAYGDSQDVLDVTKQLECQVITYGFDHKNNWTAENITYNDLGNPAFDVKYKGNYFGHFEICIPGKHNVLNALAVIACGEYCGLTAAEMADALKYFGGAKRRFELAGKVNDISVYEDYAHHPTELKVVVQACINHAHNKLWVVCQPHSYSRLYYLFDEFVDAFNGTDELILTEIYSNREGNEWDIFPEDLAKRIKEKHHIPSVVLTKFDTITKYLTDNLSSGDLVLVAGAGDINQVAHDVVNKLKEKYSE